MFNVLDFHPPTGLASPHLQMVFSNLTPTGDEPPSKSLLISLNDGDKLSCEVSTPPEWQPHQATIVMVHGLGGSHLSPYMIRLSRKFYQEGRRVVRTNLRGCGSGSGLNELPYNSGNSHDVWTILETLKTETPSSPINVIGFSLGGNIIIKMAGEQGENASKFLNRVIAVCPVLNLAESVNQLSQRSNWFYHKYYLKKIHEQGEKWIQKQSISSVFEFDEKITAPLWGYANANDYYEKCSSCNFLSNIQVPCDLLLTADDPFIDHSILEQTKISASTKVWLTEHGGHMGFIAWTGEKQGFFWMDKLLLDWNLT